MVIKTNKNILAVFCIIFITGLILTNQALAAFNVEIPVNPGESYEFINNDTAEQSVLNNGSGNKFDYAIYNSNGTSVDSGLNTTYKGSLKVPGGGKLIVTIPTSGKAIGFGGYQTFFSVSTSSNPALVHVTIYPGESYAFINNDTAGQSVLNNGSGNKFDYAIYYSNGTSVGSGLNTTYDGDIKVPGGGKLIVTVPITGKAIDFGGFQTFFLASLSSNPALVHVTVNPGESYEFVNNDKAEHSLLNNGSGNKFDYAIYYSNGTSVGSGLNKTYDGDIKVPSGGKLIATVPIAGKAIDFGGFQTFFSASRSSNPALVHVAVNPGESYEFVNNDKAEHSLLNNGSGNKFDYAIYYSNGTSVGSGLNITYDGDIKVPGGGKLISTVPIAGKALDFGGYQTFFSASLSSNPALVHITVNPGESYEFINNDTVNHHVLNNGNSNKFDYTIYNSAGASVGSGINTTYKTSLDVPGGGKLVVTVSASGKAIDFGGLYYFFNKDDNPDGPPVLSGFSGTYTVNQGDKFPLPGSISSSTPLTAITVGVVGWYDSYLTDQNPNSNTYSLSKFIIDTSKDVFTTPGSYIINIWAKSTGYPNPTSELGRITLTVKAKSSGLTAPSFINPPSDNLDLKAITVNWTNTGAPKYLFKMADITGMQDVGPDGKTIIYVNNLTVTSYTIKTTDLEAGHKYRIYVAALDANGQNETSNPQPYPVFTIKNSINDFTCTDKTDVYAGFSFTAPAGATAVKVQQSKDGGNTWSNSVTGTLNASSTHASVTSLTQKTAYKFKLVVTGGINAGDSNVVDVTTNTAGINVALTVSNPSTTGFTLSLSKALPGLKSSDFILKDEKNTPVTITSVTTTDNGVTYAIKTTLTAGKAYIVTVVKTGYNFGTAQVNIQQTEVGVTGVKLNKTTISVAVGANETLIATISPTTATNQNVTWKSSKTSIATVDSNGKVVGVRAGTAAITVTTVDGKKTATCKITVKNAP